MFSASLPRLHAPRHLLMAAVALSMHELTDVDPTAIDAELQRLADTVRSRAPSGTASALLAHVHALLFEELGFHGNDQVFGDAGASYLPLVLRRRTGLPIALSLVYKNVVERLGLRVEGINAPGHFLVAVQVRGAPMLVDAFARGRVLTRVEALERAAAATGRPRHDGVAALPIASHREWLRRMLRNLQALFVHRGERDKFAAMAELARLL